jgi:hypothetical protein
MKTGAVVSLNVGNYDYAPVHTTLHPRRLILILLFTTVYIPSVTSRNHFYYVISLFCYYTKPLIFDARGSTNRE